MSNSFTQLRYFHIKREYNKVAHSLVIFVVNVPNFLVWKKDVPSQFIFVLQANLAYFS